MNEGMPPADAFGTAKTTLLRELEEQIAQAEQAARDAASVAEGDGSAKSEVDADAHSGMQLAGTIEPPTPRVRLA
jgi:hypothetical protein